MSAQRAVSATCDALAVAALAACTSFGYEPTPLPQSSGGATARPSASATTAASTCTNALESYTPPAAVPTNLSGYPTVDKIRTHGRLIVGGSAISAARGAQPDQRPDRGLRRRPGAAGREGHLRRLRQDPAAGHHHCRAHPGAAGRQRGPGHQRDDH
jgi:hypothetical protein